MADNRSTYGSDARNDFSDIAIEKLHVDGVIQYKLVKQKQYAALVKAMTNSLYSEEIAKAEEIYNAKLEQEQELEAKLRNSSKTRTNRDRDALRKLREERKSAEANLAKAKENMSKKTVDILDTYEANAYSKMNVFQRAAFQKTCIDRKKAQLEASKEEQSQIEYQIELLKEQATTATGSRKDAIQKEIENLQAESTQIGNATQKLETELTDHEKEYNILYEVLPAKDKAEDRKEKVDSKSKELAAKKAEAKLAKKQVDKEPELKPIEKLAKKIDIGIKSSKEQSKLNNEIFRESIAGKFDQAAAKNEEAWSAEGLADNLEKNLAKTFEKVGAAITAGLNQINDNVSTFYQYQTTVESRLQGSNNGQDYKYKDSVNKITKNVAFSGYIKQKDVINNLVKLVDSGVAYNVDSRAFIATVSDKIASSFDAFDNNLLRMIRIQQADTTAARLGMEASLIRLFNEYFSDNSYLSNAFDNVAAAITDAAVLKEKNESLAFEHAVQKWLGALYSVGWSDSAINKIAEGISLIGTGNIDALNNDDALQTLFALSASKAGVSYTDLIQGDLSLDNTNKLLKGMVTYLQEIANNTDTNVVTKSAYANLLGLSTTELRSVQNISESTINSLMETNLDYEGAIKTFVDNANMISKRTHISQVLDTVIDNALMSASTTLASNSGVWGTWMALNIIEDLTGGIDIPAISVMGSGVDLNTTVVALAKTGMAGLGLMGSLLSALGNGSFGANFDIKAWGFEEYTTRGQQIVGRDGSKGPYKGISFSEEFSDSFGWNTLNNNYYYTYDYNDWYNTNSEYINTHNNSVINNNTDNSSYNESYNNNYSNSNSVNNNYNQNNNSENNYNNSYENNYSNNQYNQYDNNTSKNITFVENTNQNNQYFSNSGYTGSSLNSEYNKNYSNSSGSVSNTNYSSRKDSPSSAFESNVNEENNEYTGSADADSVKQNSLASGAESAESDSSITNSETQKNTEIYDKIYNAIADDQVTTISRINELHSMISAVSANNTISVSLDSSDLGTLDVNIETLSDVVKKTLDDRIHTLIAAAFADETLVPGDPENPTSIVAALRAALTNIDVNVTNDFFNEYYQKQAFIN